MIDLYPLAKPLIHTMDPEAAHNLTVKMLSRGITGKLGRPQRFDRLKTNVFGLDFDNPIGLAAGFDKNAETLCGSLALGFGFVEAGTVTPKPQPGNDKPRLFRLTKDQAVINRFGFNNNGLEYFADKLSKHGQNSQKNMRGIVGANVGANKESDDRTADYEAGIERLYGLSDYFTVNISSPNTPGLRALQSRDALIELINRVLAVRAAKMLDGMVHVPILVKIAPDLTDEDIADIAEITLSTDIDGLIVSNTTIARPSSLLSADKEEVGGLSGAPLMEPSTAVLKRIYQATSGAKPLIGVGGINSGADAYHKIRAGASLVQLYSALVYKGPGLVEKIKSDLNKLLRDDGFDHVSEAIGKDCE